MKTLRLTCPLCCHTTSDSCAYLMNLARFENFHGVLCAIGYLTAGALKQSYVRSFYSSPNFVACLLISFSDVSLCEVWHGLLDCSALKLHLEYTYHIC
jgi:hypothetical protein